MLTGGVLQVAIEAEMRDESGMGGLDQRREQQGGESDEFFHDVGIHLLGLSAVSASIHTMR